jgi:hypothetical protein
MSETWYHVTSHPEVHNLRSHGPENSKFLHLSTLPYINVYSQFFCQKHRHYCRIGLLSLEYIRQRDYNIFFGISLCHVFDNGGTYFPKRRVTSDHIHVHGMFRNVLMVHVGHFVWNSNERSWTPVGHLFIPLISSALQLFVANNFSSEMQHYTWKDPLNVT